MTGRAFYIMAIFTQYPQKVYLQKRLQHYVVFAEWNRMKICKTLCPSYVYIYIYMSCLSLSCYYVKSGINFILVYATIIQQCTEVFLSYHFMHLVYTSQVALVINVQVVDLVVNICIIHQKKHSSYIYIYIYIVIIRWIITFGSFIKSIFTCFSCNSSNWNESH